MSAPDAGDDRRPSSEPTRAMIQKATEHAPRGPKLVPGAAVAGGRYRLLEPQGGTRGLAFWRAKEPCIKYGSRRGYRHKVELAKGWFEGQGMREITSTDINRELMHMAAQGYAYKSIAGQKSVLSLIWQYWCAEMHGDANPCTLLKLPQGLPQTKRRAPTEQEIADVKAHPEGFGLCPAIMMYAGLRLGEVMALQKKDLADGAIRVC